MQGIEFTFHEHTAVDQLFIIDLKKKKRSQKQVALTKLKFKL